MPQEFIEYVTKLIGQQQVAAGFQQIANAQKESASAADQLSQRLKATSRIAEVEARAAARAYDVAAKSIVTAGQAAKAANDGFDTVTKGAKGSAIALGNFVNAAQGIVPELEGIGAAVVRSSSVIGSLTTMLGVSGPFAVAAGVAVAAIGTISAAFKGASDEADNFAKAVEAANKAADEAFFQRGQRFAATQTKLAAQQAEELRLRAADQAVGSQGFGTVENTETLAAIAAAEKSAFGDRIPKDKKAGPTAAELRAAANADTIKNLDAQLAQSKRIEQEMAARDKAIYDKRAEQRKIDTDLAAEDEKRAADMRIATRDAAAKREIEIERRKHDAIKAVTQQAYSAIAGTIASALASAVTGANVSTKEVLHSIGLQAANMGFLNLLQAPVDVFWNPAKAAAEFAAGAAEVALGAALGSATSGGGGSSSGVGGGFQRTAAPASPVPYNVSRDGGSVNGASPAPVTINVYGKPDADFGELVHRSVRKAQQQGRI